MFLWMSVYPGRYVKTPERDPEVYLGCMLSHSICDRIRRGEGKGREGKGGRGSQGVHKVETKRFAKEC